jgi:hypothetical protein
LLVSGLWLAWSALRLSRLSGSALALFSAGGVLIGEDVAAAALRRGRSPVKRLRHGDIGDAGPAREARRDTERDRAGSREQRLRHYQSG